MSAYQVLSAHVISELKALEGRAKVSYAGANVDYPTVERMFKVLLSEAQKVFASADEEYTGATLVDQRLIESANTYAFIYCRWETLPGVWLPFTRYDDNLGPVQGRRRPVVASGQLPTLTATAKTTYEAKDGSSIVSWQIEEGWSDGTGSAGNPAYPIVYRDDYDNVRGPFQAADQIIVKTGSEVGSYAIAGGVLTKTSYEPFNEFLLKRTVETSAVPGPVFTRDDYDEQRGALQITEQLIERVGSEVGSLAVADGVLTKIAYEPLSAITLRKVIETSAIPGPVTTSKKTDNFGGAVTTQASLVVGTTTPANTISGFTLTGITILYGGTGYVGTPAVTISAPGGGGVTATATATLTLGVVTSIALTSPGSGYTSAPTVTVAAGAGNTAFAGILVTGTPHAQELVGRDAVTARLVEYIFAVGVASRRIRKADPGVPGSRAVESRYLVLQVSTIPNDTTYTEYERQEFPEHPDLEVEIATTFEVPPQYAEREASSHPMPTLHYAAFTVTGLGTFWSRRQGFVANVTITHSHVFSATISSVAPDAIIPATWSLPKDFADQALTPASAGPSTFDEPTATFTALGREYTYTNGASSYTVILDASTPSSEDYRDNWIGATKIIGVSSRIWRAGIYQTTFSSCVMQ